MCRHQTVGKNKSMKATGVRYLQFIPCLDPLGMPQGQQNYSLTPELYARFLCALFDAWYRDWKTSTYVSVRLFEDYIHLLMGGPAVTCSTTGRCGGYMVVEGRCLPVKKCGCLSLTAGRSPQNVSHADGYTCAAAAASVTVIPPTKRSAATTAKPCKSFSPMRNCACARWPAPCRCIAEKGDRFYCTRKINTGSCFYRPLN